MLDIENIDYLDYCLINKEMTIYLKTPIIFKNINTKQVTQKVSYEKFCIYVQKFLKFKHSLIK